MCGCMGGGWSGLLFFLFSWFFCGVVFLSGLMDSIKEELEMEVEDLGAFCRCVGPSLKPRALTAVVLGWMIHVVSFSFRLVKMSSRVEKCNIV